MAGDRKRRTRGGVLALAMALCLSAAALPGSAHAYQQIYCNGYVLYGNECPSSGLHTWYYNSAAEGNSRWVCEYMWNAHNGVIRGGSITCGYGFTSRTWSRPRNAWYNARVVNDDRAGWTLYLVGNAIA